MTSDTNTVLLNALVREGVLIDVSIRYWRGTKKLNAEDLGLKAENVCERLISLGHKRLFPKERTATLALIESRAHAFIEHNTFPFLNGLAHFVPNAKLSEVTQALNTLEQDFWAAKRRFLDSYGTLRESAIQEWNAIAQRLVPDPQRLLATIEASFPPAATLERSFGFDTQLFQIAAPERLGLDLVALGDQEQLIASRNQAAQAAADKIRQQSESFIADCVASLREQTAQLCEEMLQSMQTATGGVHQKTLNRLIHFIDQFKQLNFVGDQAMEDQLERVRQEFLTRSAEDYRNDEHARARLQHGLRALSNHAHQLAKQDTRELIERFGQMGQRKFHLVA